MAKYIEKPTIITAAGQPPKSIEEYIGRVKSGTTAVSVARMKSPPGWSEPGQTPEYARLVETCCAPMPGAMDLLDRLRGRKTLSALVVLANYERPDSDGAVIPHAAGCQSIGILTYREAASEQPRAVVGLNDLSARKAVRRLGQDLVTVSVPWALFQKMEAGVAGSFLEKAPWTELL